MGYRISETGYRKDRFSEAGRDGLDYPFSGIRNPVSSIGVGERTL